MIRIKILIDHPNNIQELLIVGEGGGYIGPGTILWDERINGDMGDVTPGGLIKSSGVLVHDDDRQALHDAAVAAASIPQEVTMRQAELALKDAGYFDAVQTWVAGLDGELESYWKRSLTVKRGHSFVEAARVELGITDAQMDALFTLAKTKEE